MDSPLTPDSASATIASLGVLLIGAGAVAKHFYCPLFVRGVTGLHLRAIADSSGESLALLGNVPPGTSTYQLDFNQALDDADLMAEVDMVIVALPHHLHAACVVRALECGKHVFCEKPLGLNTSEVERIAATALSHGRVVGVCQPRRNYPAARAIKEMLDSNRLGKVIRAEWREGQPYAWPAASLAQILDRYGGSELFDIGAHVLDLLHWWFGALTVESYEDDSLGGTAAEYEIGLENEKGATIDVSLSRLRRLENQFSLNCEHGSLTWNIRDPDQFSVSAPKIFGLDSVQISRTGGQRGMTIVDAVALDLAQFAQAVLNSGVHPNATPADAVAYTRCFEQCRAFLRPSNTARPQTRSSGVYVVTGAAGFIGCAVVERLLERGAEVVALIHSVRSAVRLARSNVSMLTTDITRSDALADRISPGSVVLHCAVAHGNPFGTIVDGTLNVLRAATRAGARRVVVLSSMLAMGDPPTQGLVTESTTLSGSSMAYAQAKAVMEKEAFRYATEHRLELVILRPTCVFGPFGSDFGSQHINAMLENRFFLVDQGRGRANLVYIDNLVGAILLAADTPGIGGRTYIVNEEETNVSWAEYFGSLAQSAIGRELDVIPSFTVAEIADIKREWTRKHSFPQVFRDAVRAHAGSRTWLGNSKAFSAWHKLRGANAPSTGKSARPFQGGLTIEQQDAVSPRLKQELRDKFISAGKCFVDRSYASFFASEAIYSSSLARTELGWAPVVGRAEAMRRLGEWARNAYASA